MTVKAFIKNEEKKRSKDAETHAPEAKDTPTPGVAPSGSPVPVPATEVEASAGTPGALIGEAGAQTMSTREDSESGKGKSSAAEDVCTLCTRFILTLKLTFQ